MILPGNALPRRICAVPLFLLLFLDELIRTVLGWPINQNLFQRASTTTPSTSSLSEHNSSSTSVFATALLPFFTNDTNSATVATGHSVNSTVLSTTNTTDAEHWNNTRNGSGHQSSGDSFVEDHAGVWVISVMSGTCILTIAFIVRALFSRAEAFRDPQENMFAQDGMDEHGGMGFGTHSTGPPGTDFGYI